jgi:hypothetical protein
MVVGVHWQHPFRSAEIVISDGCRESSVSYLLSIVATQTCERLQMPLKEGQIFHEEVVMVAAVEGAWVEHLPWRHFLERRVNVR